MTTWTCTYCTLINKTDVRLCQACGSENPTATPVSGQGKERTGIIGAITRPISNFTNAMTDLLLSPGTPKEIVIIQNPSAPIIPPRAMTVPPPRPPPPPHTKRSPVVDSKRRRGGRRSANSAVPDFESSLCSEVGAEVELRDVNSAHQTYESIKAFCREQQACFIDDSFPHSSRSIGKLDQVQQTGVPGRAPTEFEWLRPQSIFTKDGRSWPWAIFRDPQPIDIEQGTLGDCWLLSAMALIAERPEILEHIVVTKEYTSYGVYQLRVCVDGHWKVVIVDDFLPCNKHTRTISFGSGRKNQLWVPLIEKAIAKQLGGYDKLVGGRTIEGLAILTGAPCEQITIQLSEDQDMLWARLLSAREANFIMGCSCGSSRDREVNEDVYKMKGLLTQHAYSILDVRQEGSYRLLRIRNPWGQFVWNGAFSDKWPGWAEHRDLRERLFRKNGHGMGSFWMSFTDFVAHFDAVDIAKVRSTSGWSELRVPMTMGGMLINNDKAVRIVVEENTEVSITLFQNGARTITDRVDLMICVHKVSIDGHVSDLVCRSKRSLEGSTSTGDTFLPPGEYIIISHSLSTLSAAKVEGSLVIHSSRILFGDMVQCTGDMITDSLVQMIIKEGVIHDTLTGVVPRYVTKDFSGMIMMIDNITDDLWCHVKTECSESTNVLSSRGSLDVADVIPPLSRQIVIILTHFEPSNGYLVHHRLFVRLSQKPNLRSLVPTAGNRIMHWPEFDSDSSQKAHSAKSVFG